MSTCVVIPAYNAEKWLERTVSSVLRQTVSDWTLRIVNDGSTDATGSIAERLAANDERIAAIHVENGGVSQARNMGFEHSPSDAMHVLFLDADDLLRSDALAILQAASERAPSAAAVFGERAYINQDGLPIAIGATISPSEIKMPLEINWRMFVGQNWIGTPGCALIPRWSFEKAQGFDPDLAVIEDWDLWLRLAMLSPLIPVNQIIMDYRIHPQSSLRNPRLSRYRWNMSQRMWAKWIKNATQADKSYFQRQYRIAMRKHARTCFEDLIYAVRTRKWKTVPRQAIKAMIYAGLCCRPMRSYRP